MSFDFWQPGLMHRLRGIPTDPIQKQKDARKMLGFSMDMKKCPVCNDLIHMDDFKDPLSLKEYQISGMCQKCQDHIFEVPDE